MSDEVKDNSKEIKILSRLITNKLFEEMTGYEIRDFDKRDKEFYEFGFDNLDEVEMQMTLEEYNIFIEDDVFDKLKTFNDIENKVIEIITNIGYDKFVEELNMCNDSKNLIEDE